MELAVLRSVPTPSSNHLLLAPRRRWLYSSLHAAGLTLVVADGRLVIVRVLPRFLIARLLGATYPRDLLEPAWTSGLLEFASDGDAADADALAFFEVLGEEGFPSVSSWMEVLAPIAEDGRGLPRVPSWLVDRVAPLVDSSDLDLAIVAAAVMGRGEAPLGLPPSRAARAILIQDFPERRADLVSHEDPWIRGAIARSSRLLGGDLPVELLSDANARVRFEAARAAGRLRAENGIWRHVYVSKLDRLRPALEAQLAVEPDDRVRRRLEAALDQR